MCYNSTQSDCPMRMTTETADSVVQTVRRHHQDMPSAITAGHNRRDSMDGSDKSARDL